MTKLHIQKYVIYTPWIKTYITKEHYMFVKELELLGWILIDLKKINIEKFKTENCILLCVTYDDFDISVLKCDTIQLIYKIDDLYPYKEIRNKCISAADIIIGPYQYLFDTPVIKKMYKNITNSFHIPYSAVNVFFKNINFNTEPIYKIFVSGAVQKVYPLRTYIKEDERFKPYIDTLDHPSYKKLQHACIDEKYYKKLNEYLCCFVDAVKYKYILLKVFEICSVGSLLLVEDSIKVELNKLGFQDSINCIMCNKGNLESKIKWILDVRHREEIDIIRKKGMHLVRNHHTTEDRAQKFNNIIQKINIPFR
jgi:hypothetical protein